MKRAVLILMLAAAMMGACVDRVDAQSSEPAFRVENSRIDLGKIKSGTDVLATYVFHNDGPTDVKIIKAKPS